MLSHQRRHRSWVHGLRNRLPRAITHLTIEVSPQPAQEREAAGLRRWHQGPGECGLSLEPVLDLSPSCWATDLFQLGHYANLGECIIANALIDAGHPILSAPLRAGRACPELVEGVGEIESQPTKPPPSHQRGQVEAPGFSLVNKQRPGAVVRSTFVC